MRIQRIARCADDGDSEGAHSIDSIGNDAGLDDEGFILATESFSLLIDDREAFHEFVGKGGWIVRHPVIHAV